MMMRFLIAFLIAIGVGKLVSKLKLPAILGWLLAGMILGPHAIGLINQSLLDSVVYGRIINILECSVGLMIGTELVWKKNQECRKTNYHYNFDSVTWDFSLCEFGFWHHFLLYEAPHLSCLLIWWDCFSNSF